MPIAWFKDTHGRPANAFIVATKGLSANDRELIELSCTFNHYEEMRRWRTLLVCGGVLAILGPLLIAWAIANVHHDSASDVVFMCRVTCIPTAIAILALARVAKRSTDRVNAFIANRINQDILIFGRAHLYWAAFVETLDCNGTWYLMHVDMITMSVTGEWLSGTIASHLAALKDPTDVRDAYSFAENLRVSYLARTHATQQS